MDSSQPWKPAREHSAIEAMVRSEVLPEVFERLKRKKQAHVAAAREAEARASSLQRLSKLFNLPTDGGQVSSPWHGQAASRVDC